MQININPSNTKGFTITHYYISESKDKLILYFSNGLSSTYYHEQDCCEQVWIEDICGDLAVLIGNPLLTVEERINEPKDTTHNESETWTFYEFATIKGSVTIRWVGASNGYYSESVDHKLKGPEQAFKKHLPELFI